MDPRYLEELSWRFGEVYEAVVDQILINLARHFKYLKPGEVTGSWEYQIKKLAEMGQVNRETEKIILNMLGDADGVLKGLLEDAIIDGLKDAEPELRKAAEKGLLYGGVSSISPSQMQAFSAYYNQSADKLNLVNTVMLESTTWAYQSTVADIVTRINNAQGILNIATGEVITGVETWNKAVKDAVQKMVLNGITGYVDHGGHRWSPETYVAMDVRTTMANTARAAVDERMEIYGCELYSVSWHNAARPLCFPWQGKVLSKNGWTGEVEDLYGNKVTVHSEDEPESFRYGGGLFGVNCGHYEIPFVPGFSRIREPKQTEAENAEAYKNTQKQRYLERRLRDEKRDLEVMKAQGASEEEIKEQRKRIAAAIKDIDEFCNETGLTRRRNRETAPVRATWPTDAGPVTRYNGGYIRTDATPPPKGPFTPTTTPPTVPPTVPPAAPPANVAPQVTPQQKASGIFDNVKGLPDDFKKGMADTLDKTDVEEAKALYKKFADQLVCVDSNYTGGAKFNRFSQGVFMNAAEVAAGNSYETPYETAFHEFGHMIDWLANGKQTQYLSNTEVDGKRILPVIKSDFKAFKKSLGVKKASDVIDKLKAENMDKRTRGNISDILEPCVNKSYPLNLGHGVSYHKRDDRTTEAEFFAEVLDSAVANKPSYEQMKRIFPTAVDMVWKLVKEVTK